MTISGRMSLSQKQEGARVPSRPLKRAIEFFEEIKAEFLRINWTEGDEVLSYAKVVVISMFVFGMVIYVTDLVVNRGILGLDNLFKLIVG